MHADQLKARQTPLKTRYREQPEAALVTFHSRGTLDVGQLVCRVETARGSIDSGLHPAAGGDAGWACSGDMLLDALVACAGVTLSAVATSMGIELRGATITAEGDVDFRGTLGVSKEVPIGLSGVRLHFSLDTTADDNQVQKLIQLTERYCVIYQSLRAPPTLVTSVERQ